MISETVVNGLSNTMLLMQIFWGLYVNTNIVTAPIDLPHKLTSYMLNLDFNSLITHSKSSDSFNP